MQQIFTTVHHVAPQHGDHNLTTRSLWRHFTLYKFLINMHVATAMIIQPWQCYVRFVDTGCWLWPQHSLHYVLFIHC